MFLGVHFKKMCGFVDLLFKLNIMYFHQSLKNLDIQKMIYHHFYFYF